MTLAVLSTPEADAQVRAIDEWWRTNRPASPSLFVEELATAFDIIGHTQNIGRPYRVPGTRRVLLSGTRYHVYYAPQRDNIVVLAVWHAQRGVGPPLRVP